MAIVLTGSLAVCLSHVRCSHMLLPLSCLLMPLFVSLVLARTLLFSPNATSLNAYATSLNAYSHTLAPISHPTPPQSRAKGKATISRGVEPADHKVSRRRVADCTGAREYLVEGTVRLQLGCGLNRGLFCAAFLVETGLFRRSNAGCRSERCISWQQPKRGCARCCEQPHGRPSTS